MLGKLGEFLVLKLKILLLFQGFGKLWEIDKIWRLLGLVLLFFVVVVVVMAGSPLFW